MAEKRKFIDVKRVISDKNPKLLKWLPGFLVRYIQKILHEEQVNDFLLLHKGDNSFEFCRAAIEYMDIHLTAAGVEHVPASGGCILAINHPLGGMDAMAIVTQLESTRRDIKFIVNDVLLNLENLKEMFVGVNLIGKNAKDSLRKVDELFATDQLICVFPAGLVSRKTGGVVEDLEWKKTFVTRARKHQKPIIPVHINGALSDFFYRLARLRKAIGLKANIEMLYLVNELFKQRGVHMHVVFGKPINPGDLNNDKTDLEWAQEIKKEVYQLAKQDD
ncbi:MAG: 1-acyl-sn-glycerol-3-phosphate acyltransferase [Saprospiraceae bacterium]|nr:1-acyl-sn-glycerol-3-phosphate acyltransferase [Saprospiraceae bacterium]